MTRFVLISCFILLSACTEPAGSDIKVIIGATLINASEPPVSHSVIVVKDDYIVAAGPQQMVPVPPGSAKTEAYGKFLTLQGGGEVKVGSKANLILLDGHPDSNPKVERRMIDGRWVQ